MLFIIQGSNPINNQICEFLGQNMQLEELELSNSMII